VSYLNSFITLPCSHLVALSELGRKAYLNFWSATIARHIVGLPAGEIVTVKSISEATYILPEDVIATLNEMDVIERSSRSDDAALNKPAIISWMTTNRIGPHGPVDETAFIDQEPPNITNGD